MSFGTLVNAQWHVQNGEGRQTFGTVFNILPWDGDFWNEAFARASRNMIDKIEQDVIDGRLRACAYVIDHPADAQ